MLKEQNSVLTVKKLVKHMHRQFSSCSKERKYSNAFHVMSSYEILTEHDPLYVVFELPKPEPSNQEKFN